MARPHKRPEDLRSVRLWFRLTRAEREILETRADEVGLTISDHVRAAVLAEATTRVARRRMSRDDASLVRALSAVGNNINQISRRLASSGALSHEAIDAAMRELIELIRELRADP